MTDQTAMQELRTMLGTRAVSAEVRQEAFRTIGQLALNYYGGPGQPVADVVTAMVDADHGSALADNYQFDQREISTASYMAERACFDQSTSYASTPAHRRPYVLREALARYASTCELGQEWRMNYASRVRAFVFETTTPDAMLAEFGEWARDNILEDWRGNGGSNCDDGTNRVLRWLGQDGVSNPCEDGTCDDDECDTCRPEETVTVTVTLTVTYEVTGRSIDTSDLEYEVNAARWHVDTPHSITSPDYDSWSVDVDNVEASV